jgi:hypothetical protein
MPRAVRRLATAAALAAVLAACGLTPARPATSVGGSSGSTSAPSTAPTTTSAPAYAYYYLWWSSQHWHDKLGPAYPYGQRPLPLPATRPATECPPSSLFAGNQLTDVPEALFSQDDPAVAERDVRSAAGAGLSGFLANWRGTGLVGQVTTDSSLSRRLASLVSAVHKVQAEGVNFHLQINLQASSTLLTPSAIANDLDYLVRTYSNDAAFDRIGNRLVVVWTGSRKYGDDVLSGISARFRSAMFLVGDESWKTWTSARAASLDGDTYYWSTQDPYGNPASFGQLRTLATMVRGSGPNPDGTGKRWFAPFTPGYDSRLNGGSTCIPRRDGQTMRSLYRGNAATNPDGWFLISWNEITEGTYVEPLQRYKTRYLDVLRSVLAGPG